MTEWQATAEDWSETLREGRRFIAATLPVIERLRREHGRDELATPMAVLREQAADVVELVGWLRETDRALAGRHADTERLAREALARVGRGERGPGNREEMDMQMTEPTNVVDLAAERRTRADPYKLRDMTATQDWQAYLEDLFDAEVTRVRAFGRGAGRWQLVLRVRGEERTVELSDDELFTPRLLKRAIWRATLRTPRLRRGESDDVADALGEAVESELGEIVDSTLSRADETREWLAGFLDNLGLGRVDDPAELYELLGSLGSSFITPEGRYYLRLRDVIRHVHLHYGQRTSHQDVAARLGDVGFVKDQLAARPPGGGKERKGRYWVSPVGFEP